MTPVLRDASEVTPQVLSAILRREGVLGRDGVLGVRSRRNPAFNSRTWHLDVSYGHPDGAGPTSLLLKANVPEPWARRAGQREVALYDLARMVPGHPDVLVRAFDTAFDPSSQDSHLLLLDVSGTHDVALSRELQLTPGRNVPGDGVLTACVTALARLQAFWWQHPLLGGEVVQLPVWCRDEDALVGAVERRRQAFEALRDEEGGEVGPRLLRLYERVFGGLSHVWRTHLLPRVRSGRALTLAHGDAYPSNFFVPKGGVDAPTFIIDWQSHEAWMGAQDLATICATFWTREQRLAGDRERGVLRLYLDTLFASGVRGYGWADLVADYRLALVYWLLVPLQDRLDGAERSYWLTKMTCLEGAFEDWEVEALFGG